ncbi:hypothetical protein HZS_2609, partial [Henneguya salminicola]
MQRNGKEDRDFYGGVPQDVDKMVSIKVDNLSSKTRIEDLKHIFENYGLIGDIYIPRNANTGRPKGFAFVRYYRTRDGDRAIRDMDGRRIEGSLVTVSWARHERFVRREHKYRRSRSSSRGYTHRHRNRSSHESYAPIDRNDSSKRKSRSRSISSSPMLNPAERQLSSPQRV